MKIHEYQAKATSARCRRRRPQRNRRHNRRRSLRRIHQTRRPLAVVKAQIHAGGRGKGTIADNPAQHGVQLVKSPGDAASAAGALLHHKLVTIQTGPAGQTVRRVLVEAGCEIARELYLGIVIDRAAGLPVLMASSAGGMNIEDVAAKTPELIFKETFDPDAGLQSYQVRKLCAQLNYLASPSEEALSGVARPTNS